MKLLFIVFVMIFTAGLWAGPPKGKPETPRPAESAALSGLKGKINGRIVWSSSRNGNHDIYIMNADGTDKRPLTRSGKTDWFPRFSPDGRSVIFTRSKLDWTTEANADNPQMWDTWMTGPDSARERLLIKNAAWATWRPDGRTVVFARGTEIWSFDVSSKTETKLLDSRTDGFKKAAILQNPHMSPNGEYFAITLRGRMRETGVWDIKAKTWAKVGPGCQINWFPQGDRIYTVNPTGNGGSEIFRYRISNGKPVDTPKKDLKYMDLPGRRSHEYFPQLSRDGKWMVWAATRRGHDHDIADYEIYVWDTGTGADKAVRLTFHSGNDRWPDIFIKP